MSNVALTAASGVNHEVAAGTAGEEDDRADHDEAEADCTQGCAAAVAGEEDGEGVEEQDERGQRITQGR